MSISFKINQEKVLECIVYLANKQPNIDIYHCAKTIFYADKWHLNRYARPILGDVYIKMEHGPVPSLVKDIIGKTRFLPLLLQKKISASIETRGRNKNIVAKREPDLTYFSESDLMLLDEALDFCKDKSFSQLRDLSHREKSWINANMNNSMDYELLIDDDNENRDGIIEDLKENAPFLEI